MVMKPIDDVAEGRIGEWMHTSTGKRFFPLDPRPEDICISDIANGLAMDIRYGGQGRVDRIYTVAEHCCHVAKAAYRLHWPPEAVFAALLHDAAEAYLNDLPRAVKHAVGLGYSSLEENVQRVILAKYGLTDVARGWADQIKDLDRRVVPLEKAAIMRYPQEWAYDQFEPLPSTVIYCLSPEHAKAWFLKWYEITCHDLGITPEETEI